ncbi:MAG: hypothetical protein QF909_17600, partial [SAR202 cluster bacterium]|nr:hypothetical protein [SAR202 cluster bacterium]
ERWQLAQGRGQYSKRGCKFWVQHFTKRFTNTQTEKVSVIRFEFNPLVSVISCYTQFVFGMKITKQLLYH